MRRDQPYRAVSIKEVERLAREGLPVLLLGPSEESCSSLARRLHELSNQPGAFVRYACCPLPERPQGARALRSRCSGLFARASSGTLYFHRVDRLSRAEQRQLYSVLENGLYWAPDIGAKKRVDFRIVASGPSDILHSELMPDLIYRLGARVVELGESRT